MKQNYVFTAAVILAASALAAPSADGQTIPAVPKLIGTISGSPSQCPGTIPLNVVYDPQHATMWV